MNPGFEIRDQVAVLTGAAGGIGAGLARALAAGGCHLALVDRDGPRLEAAAALARPFGVRVSLHQADLTDPAAIAGLPAAVLAAHGSASLLLNNAGAALVGTFDQISEPDLQWLMEVNFWSGVRMTRAFLPALRQALQIGALQTGARQIGAPRAWLVFVSSVYGLVAPPGETAYAASKFAIRGFAEALRHELAETGIGVTLVHPGGIKTAIARNARLSAGIDLTDHAEGVAQFEAALRTSPEQAAAAILRGIGRGRKRVLIGGDARMIDAVQRAAPAGYWGILKTQFPQPETKAKTTAPKTTAP